MHLFLLSKRRAFTLVEIMIVMALLGVVASIATVSFSATVNRLEYNDYVRKIHSVFAQARNQAIVTNSTQRVVCNFGAQSLERRAQRINESRSGYDESVVQKLNVPHEVCILEESDDGTLMVAEAGGPGAYTFLPDGFGNEFKPLSIDIIQGDALKRKLYWNVSRDSRGKVVLSGPKRVSER